MKTIIIGGVAGGATAATRLRRLDEKAEIIVLERSGFVSYANCGLPYFIGGVIREKSELTLQTPSSLWERFRIDVRTKQEAEAIDPQKKTVMVKDLITGKRYEEHYDKLILAPGAKAVRPKLPGIDSGRVFTLRTVEDTYRLRDYIDESKPQSAAIIGGGFIGLEVAENLIHLGIKVTVMQRPNQLLNTLDYDMATFVHAKLRQKGITLKLGSSVTGFSEADDGIAVHLKDESELKADFVLMAVGVAPDSELAKAAGLELGIKDSILVNDRMETSVPDIYAVGDAVQVKHRVSELDALIALAGPANKQGRIAADNICGGDSRYKGSIGSSVIQLFDLTVASTGLTEKAAKTAGIACDRIVLSPSSHASYYPGARVMTMKVVFEKGTLRLLGAQMIGYDGVDKRLDVIAAAIAFGARADDLKDMDLAYAPPYSSAKDPINYAGFMADNIYTGKLKQFHWEEVKDLPRDGSVHLLDVRTAGEYTRGHADGFVNLPVDELRKHLMELDPSKPVYVMCQSGLRSYIACRILMNSGFDAYNFSGGYRFYEAVTKEKALCEGSYPCGMDRQT